MSKLNIKIDFEIANKFLGLLPKTQNAPEIRAAFTSTFGSYIYIPVAEFPEIAMGAKTLTLRGYADDGQVIGVQLPLSVQERALASISKLRPQALKFNEEQTSPRTP